MHLPYMNSSVSGPAHYYSSIGSTFSNQLSNTNPRLFLRFFARMLGGGGEERLLCVLTTFQASFSEIS